MRATRRRRAAPARATVAFVGALFLLLAPSVACRRDGLRGLTEVRVVDLIFQFKDAERRPERGRFEFGEHTFGGRSRASLIVPGASRVTWRLFVPRRATLRVYAAVPAANGPAAAAVRLGISDGRRYDHLREQVIASDESARDWVAVSADLSFYAGRKFSLFYRPDFTKWQIVIGTYVVRGAPDAVVLGEPGLYADTEAAREYQERLRDAVLFQPPALPPAARR